MVYIYMYIGDYLSELTANKGYVVVVIVVVVFVVMNMTLRRLNFSTVKRSLYKKYLVQTDFTVL